MTITIERLRAVAEARLQLIAEEFGPESALLRQCEKTWLLAEGQAVLSVLHEDHVNAEVILSHAVQVLEHAPAVARRAELSGPELAALMRQVV